MFSLLLLIIYILKKDNPQTKIDYRSRIESKITLMMKTTTTTIALMRIVQIQREIHET